MAVIAGTHVQFGAGHSAPDGWVNFDSSPALRLQKLPLVGKALVRSAGYGRGFPDAVVYGDIVKGLPIPAGSVSGLYASHVLEHLALEDMRRALANCFTVLRPGGTFRLVVPDLLARAERYVGSARSGDPLAAPRFVEAIGMGRERHRPMTIGAAIRAQVGNSAHLWMWDHASMAQELKSAGFVDMRRAQFGDSDDPMFARVEELRRFKKRDFDEVAIETRKP